MPRSCAAELAPYLELDAARARCSTPCWRELQPARPSTVDFLVELNARLQRGRRLRHPHGAGRADAGRDADARHPARAATRAWLLVQIAAPARPRGALRLRLPDPAQARHRAARRARRAPTRTSPTCTPGPRSTCRAPAGSASTRPRACSCGEGHIPLAATPHYRSAAPITRRRRAGRGRLRLRDDGHPRRRGRRASPSRSPTTRWQALDALGEQVDADLAAQDVRLTMGGEPTFVSIDDFEARGMEHRRGRADQARPRRRADPPAARPLRARRPAALRPGQMVSGRKPAALGLRALLAQGRRADLARRRPDRRAKTARATPRRTQDAERLVEGIAERLGLDAGLRRCRPTRTPATGC